MPDLNVAHPFVQRVQLGKEKNNMEIQKINENNADEDAKGMFSMFVSNVGAKLSSGL